MKNPFASLFKKVPEITAVQLHGNLENVQLVDVRTHTEFGHSHIDGAQNLPILTFTESRIAELELDQSRPVVLICLSAHRSIPATRKLIKMGFDAKQLKSGMKAWWAADFPVV
jgi:rhodanese-related sulfurtransferase